MSQHTLVVRRADRPGEILARETTLVAARTLAATWAAREPGVLFEIYEAATGVVRLRVRAENPGTVLVQRPQASSGDAWPDPPAWEPLRATA